MKCKDCKFLTNVPEELLDDENTFGGCFLTGKIVVTGDSCWKFRKRAKKSDTENGSGKKN